ncbi:dTDP-4-dehydrorhamnose reductase [Pararobbsia alpina]|uniref:SDR family oxidoreductase n=1 Tax=Pararobbsia alpina TaxID=621374 RepID=UPI0039A60B65
MNSNAGGVALGRVLVTGADGSIARALVASLAAPGNEVWGTTRRADRVASRTTLLDLAEPPSEWTLPDGRFDVAFLCAAVTSQDRCGAEPELTHRINVTHTVALARRLVSQGTFVVFLSTNLVFDGETPLAKPETAYSPRSAYGAQKAEAEQRLLALGENVAVVRLGKVIAPRMALFDGWIEALRAQREIRPFDNLLMAPISLGFAVDALVRVAAVRRPGIVHANAARDMSYAHAARAIAKRIDADPRLVEPSKGVFSPHVCSPRYAALDASGLASLGIEAPSPEAAFDAVVSP